MRRGTTMTHRRKQAQQALARFRPTTCAQLDRYLRLVLEIRTPRPPLDYLARTFFEQPGDLIVWANRGGGKTFYGAVATLLDLIFKPGIKLCILGGSFEQSARMHEHLRGFLDRPMFRDLVDGRIRQTGVRLTNGSSVALLAQAETSVRGQRVHKLRCDEVELFDDEVWRAAQFVTRGGRCGGVHVPGRIECFSTMHQPFGLMSELVQRTDATVLRWNALDVIERCEPARPCEPCPLWSCCGGRAKRAAGFLPIDDVIAQMQRASAVAFDSEMLCRRPSSTDAVYPMFDRDRHVRAVEADESLPWVGGIDFGLRNPFVMLWAQRRPTPTGERLEIVDEYHRDGEIVPTHLRAIAARGWPALRWVGVDPAGLQRNEQTGRSTIALLREAGLTVKHAATRLADGIERIRQLLSPADSPNAPRLIIHPRCERLIEAMVKYHFDPRRRSDASPIKDGPDHAADALRYLVVNLDQSPLRGARY